MIRSERILPQLPVAAPSSQMTGTPTKLTLFLTGDSSDVSCTFFFSHRWEEVPDSGQHCQPPRMAVQGSVLPSGSVVDD